MTRRALTLITAALLSVAFGLLPLGASAHQFAGQGIAVNCSPTPELGTVTVTVTGWSGHVRITRNSPLPVVVTTSLMSYSGNGSAVFAIAQIGGPGIYTADRPEDTSVPQVDPVPVHFTACFKASPTLTTQASGAAAAGNAISDTATLASAFEPAGGTITFTLFGPDNATCSGTPIFTSTKTVSGNGAYPSDPFTTVSAGTYRWIAAYSGDANNNAATGACADSNEQVSVSNPPGGSTLGASTGGSGLLPTTARSDLPPNIFLGMVMVLLGISLAGQVLFTSTRKTRQ